MRDIDGMVELVFECEKCKGTGEGEGLLMIDQFPPKLVCDGCKGVGEIRKQISIPDLTYLITEVQEIRNE